MKYKLKKELIRTSDLKPGDMLHTYEGWYYVHSLEEDSEFGTVMIHLCTHRKGEIKATKEVPPSLYWTGHPAQ